MSKSDIENEEGFQLICHFDGGCNNTTREDGYGSCSLYDSKHDYQSLLSRIPFPDVDTSNEAEYAAIILLLDFILDVYIDVGQKIDGILIIGDSRLVINQLQGNWKVNSKTLKPYFLQATNLLSYIIQYTPVTLRWTSRVNIVKVLGH